MDDLHAVVARLATDEPYDHWHAWEAVAAHARTAPDEVAAAVIAAATDDAAVANIELALSMVFEQGDKDPVFAALVDADAALAVPSSTPTMRRGSTPSGSCNGTGPPWCTTTTPPGRRSPR